MPKSGLTPYQANNIVNNITGYTGTVYAGLSTTKPVVSGNTVTNITEPSTSGTGYKRIRLTSDVIAQASEGKGYNKDIIKFDEVLSSWGTITHLVLFTAQTGGSPIAIAELASPVTPTVNSMPIFRAGSDYATANFKVSINMYDGNE